MEPIIKHQRGELITGIPIRMNDNKHVKDAM